MLSAVVLQYLSSQILGSEERTAGSGDGANAHASGDKVREQGQDDDEGQDEDITEQPEVDVAEEYFPNKKEHDKARKRRRGTGSKPDVEILLIVSAQDQRVRQQLKARRGEDWNKGLPEVAELLKQATLEYQTGRHLEGYKTMGQATILATTLRVMEEKETQQPDLDPVVDGQESDNEVPLKSAKGGKTGAW